MKVSGISVIAGWKEHHPLKPSDQRLGFGGDSKNAMPRQGRTGTETAATRVEGMEAGVFVGAEGVGAGAGRRGWD